jgi:hypothetical protein
MFCNLNVSTSRCELTNGVCMIVVVVVEYCISRNNINIYMVLGRVLNPCDEFTLLFIVVC